MITVHRINGKEFVLNCELIKTVEAIPDTMITLINKEKVMVKESLNQILDATKKYKQEVYKFPEGNS